MHQCGEGFCLRLTGKDRNASAITYAERGRDLIGKDKLDTLFFNECQKTVVVLSCIALNVLYLGKIGPICLLDIEDVGIPESDEDADILLGDVFFGVFIFLALDANDGSENADALLAFLHATAKLIPRIHARYFRGCRALSRDLKDVAKGIRMKAAHRIQVGGKRIRVSGPSLLDEAL